MRKEKLKDMPAQMKKVRTTLFFTKGINRCLDLLALKEDRPKGEIIREILEKELRARGLDPNKKITITFHSDPTDENT